jgi:hypothetical protein
MEVRRMHSVEVIGADSEKGTHVGRKVGDFCWLFVAVLDEESFRPIPSAATDVAAADDDDDADDADDDDEDDDDDDDDVEGSDRGHGTTARSCFNAFK